MPDAAVVEGLAQADALWRFAVTDNGIGICIGPEYTGRVFAIFQRLHARDAYPGKRIGLALRRKIVDVPARFVFTPPVRVAASMTAGSPGVSPP